MLKLKLQYFGHVIWRTDCLGKTLVLGKIEGRRRRGWQRMSWLDGISEVTWVWASSGCWWWTGKPGVLQSMGLQRVRHNWVTELSWTDVVVWIFVLLLPKSIWWNPNPQGKFFEMESLVGVISLGSGALMNGISDFPVKSTGVGCHCLLQCPYKRGPKMVRSPSTLWGQWEEGHKLEPGHQTLNLLAPWPWTSQPPELWEFQTTAFCYSSPTGLTDYFPKWLYHFAFLLAMHED